MTAQTNDSRYSEQFTCFSKSLYSLKNESRLSQKEKISLIQYPEEIVKEAIKVVLHRLPNKTISEQQKIYFSKKVNSKLSFLNRHKSKILIGTAIIVSTLTTGLLYKYSTPQPIKTCVEGFNDDWNDTKCINGEFIPSLKTSFPDHSRFKKLIKQCANGAQIPGCFRGNYYRELAEECKYNPDAALCNGNYDYQKDFIDPISMPGSLEDWKKKQTYNT